MGPKAGVMTLRHLWVPTGFLAITLNLEIIPNDIVLPELLPDWYRESAVTGVFVQGDPGDPGNFGPEGIVGTLVSTGTWFRMSY